MHKGSCLCETVHFEIEGDFKGFYLCHCGRCRKRTGTSHAANLFSETAKLTFTKGSEAVRTFHLPNTRNIKSFCETCGSALPVLQESGRLLVPAGSLDTEITTKPTAHIFMSSKASWEEDLDKVPKFEKLPG